jgi:hypothetical protein
MDFSSERVTNLYNYHEVIASSIKVIYDSISQGQKESAKEIIRLNIIYAETMLDNEWTAESLKELKQEQDINALFVRMVKAQDKAGLTPRQDIGASSFFKKGMAAERKRKG